MFKKNTLSQNIIIINIKADTIPRCNQCMPDPSNQRSTIRPLASLGFFLKDGPSEITWKFSLLKRVEDPSWNETIKKDCLTKFWVDKSDVAVCSYGGQRSKTSLLSRNTICRPI